MLYTGWEPDPAKTDDSSFSNDPSFRDGPLFTSASGSVDNTKYYKELSNQRNLGACTANAGADFWEAVLVHALVKQGHSLEQAHAMVPELSRLFLFYFAKSWMDPPKHKVVESGCFNRLIMEVIARKGICREDLWPYVVDKATTKPSMLSEQDAFQRRSKGFYKILETGARRVDSVVAALHVVPGVTFGTTLGSAFSTYSGGVLDPPKDDIGRHAMVLVGYDAALGAFKVRNSWANWGLGGYWWMSADYLMSGVTRSLWTAEAK
jgi:hypothetical protein